MKMEKYWKWKVIYLKSFIKTLIYFNTETIVIIMTLN